MKTASLIAILLLTIATASAGELKEKANEPKKVIIWFQELDDVNEVIEQLGTEFILEHRYQNVLGVAGTITEEGIKILDKNKAMLFLDQKLKLYLNESRRIIGAPQLESYGITGRGQAACVLDTGVDYTLQALGSCFGQNCKVVGGYDFANNDPDPIDDNGHGTHVTGIIASDHQTYRGIAPRASIVAMKVCTRGGTCWASNVIAGLDWCITNKDRFNIGSVSISLGNGIYTETNCPTYMNSMLDRAYQRGMFIVAASGNNANTRGIAYPACAPNVVSVGATYDTDVGRFTWYGETPCTDQITGPGRLACFTNRAENLDMLAPGTFITSTGWGSFYEDSGTSMATPHVAASAILVKELDQSLSPNDIERVLKSSGRLVNDPVTRRSFPEVNLVAAFGLVLQNSPYMRVNKIGG